MKKKRKTKTPRQKAKEKLMKLVKNFIKRRDEYVCQKCRKVVSGVNCHAAHVIPVAQDGRLSFDQLNIIVLCMHDHLNWWHHESGGLEWFRGKFPERMVYLELRHQQNRGTGTIPMSWFEERVEFYVQLEKGMGREVGSRTQTVGRSRFAIRN